MTAACNCMGCPHPANCRCRCPECNAPAVASGWQCPQCGRVNAPSVTQCPSPGCMRLVPRDAADSLKGAGIGTGDDDAIYHRGLFTGGPLREDA